MKQLVHWFLGGRLQSSNKEPVYGLVHPAPRPQDANPRVRAQPYTLTCSGIAVGFNCARHRIRIIERFLDCATRLWIQVGHHITLRERHELLGILIVLSLVSILSCGARSDGCCKAGSRLTSRRYGWVFRTGNKQGLPMMSH